MSYDPSKFMDDLWRYQSCRIPAVSAMEMVFKCGRTEFDLPLQLIVKFHTGEIEFCKRRGSFVAGC